MKVLCIVNAFTPMRNGEGLTVSKWVPWGEIMSLSTRNDQSNLKNEFPDHDNIGMDPLI